MAPGDTADQNVSYESLSKKLSERLRTTVKWGDGLWIEAGDEQKARDIKWIINYQIDYYLHDEKEILLGGKTFIEQKDGKYFVKINAAAFPTLQHLQSFITDASNYDALFHIREVVEGMPLFAQSEPASPSSSSSTSLYTPSDTERKNAQALSELLGVTVNTPGHLNQYTITFTHKNGSKKAGTTVVENPALAAKNLSKVLNYIALSNPVAFDNKPFADLGRLFEKGESIVYDAHPSNQEQNRTVGLRIDTWERGFKKQLAVLQTNKDLIRDAIHHPERFPSHAIDAFLREHEEGHIAR